MHMIDLIAVVSEVQPIGAIQIKATGEYRDRRTITLDDDSGMSIMATFWGDAANIDLAVGSIIAIKGARVSTYGGLSLNVGSDHATVKVDPEGEPRYHELQKWHLQ